jgi:hypothetical protein
MLLEIDKIIFDNGEFLSEMESRAYMHKEDNDLVFRRKESEKMAHILGQIYLVSHSIHCSACQGRYKV